jgi:hypothetical protein
LVELEKREQLKAFLEERKRRLADIQERGIEALSRYDREICYGGDEATALRETLRLVNNHIAYATQKLATMPKQETLW